MLYEKRLEKFFYLNVGAWKIFLGPFYDYIKMTIQPDLAIFNS